MSKQIDIFGNETEVTNPPPSGGRRYKRMQELYGITEGKTCKTCKENHGVSCDVTNCVYHDKQQRCLAGEILVGPQYACTSSDTVCATFKPEK